MFNQRQFCLSKWNEIVKVKMEKRLKLQRKAPKIERLIFKEKLKRIGLKRQEVSGIVLGYI